MNTKRNYQKILERLRSITLTRELAMRKTLWWGNLMKDVHLEDLGIFRKTLLKWVFKMVWENVDEIHRDRNLLTE